MPERLAHPHRARPTDLDRFVLEHVGEIKVVEHLPHGQVQRYEGTDVIGFVHYGRGHPCEVEALDGTVLWRADRRGRVFRAA